MADKIIELNNGLILAIVDNEMGVSVGLQKRVTEGKPAKVLATFAYSNIQHEVIGAWNYDEPEYPKVICSECLIEHEPTYTGTYCSECGGDFVQCFDNEEEYKAYLAEEGQDDEA